MRLFRSATGWVVVLMIALALHAAPQSTPWDVPASMLADQIAEILGPGQALVTIRNLSSISSDSVPIILRLIEQDLKSHGITVAGPESANAIRITLSENTRERLWVAEIVEGSETRVTMVGLRTADPQQIIAPSGIVLRSQLLITSRDPVLAVLAVPNELIALEPEQIVIYSRTQSGWQEQKRVPILQKRPLPRDPRGILVPNADLTGFQAWLAGAQCSADTAPTDAGGWLVHCQQSDDPWPILAAVTNAPAHLNAFFNAGRNYFTGVITPTPAVDLPAFYSAAVVPRPAGGSAILINDIDGKVQLIDNGALREVAGTRDWGSDFAALNSGCGAGTQIVASGSGTAQTDSLRAYELPALEAVPASPALAVQGAITAMGTAPDSKSILAVVRNSANEYEVDRVTAACN